MAITNNPILISVMFYTVPTGEFNTTDKFDLKKKKPNAYNIQDLYMVTHNTNGWPACCLRL